MQHSSHIEVGFTLLGREECCMQWLHIIINSKKYCIMCNYCMPTSILDRSEFHVTRSTHCKRSTYCKREVACRSPPPTP